MIIIVDCLSSDRPWCVCPLCGLALSSFVPPSSHSPASLKRSDLQVLHSNADNSTSDEAARARLVLQVYEELEDRSEVRMDRLTDTLSSFQSDVASDLKRLENKLDVMCRKVDDDMDRVVKKLDKVGEDVKRLETDTWVLLFVVIVMSVMGESFQVFWEKLLNHLISSM